jgi:hypothetical protein
VSVSALEAAMVAQQELPVWDKSEPIDNGQCKSTIAQLVSDVPRLQKV